MALKVLFVDDNPEILASTRRFLAQRGLDVITSDSPLGITPIVRHERPDVVVLDVMMPAIGGTTLATFLRKLTPMENVPIILYSAMDEEKLRALARQNGLEYVSKADGLPALLDAIQTRAAAR